MSYLAEPIFTDQPLEKDVRAALIADIFTDGVRSRILYEANGIPDELTVLIDDYAGKRLVRGYVYGYREFTDGLSKRLSDQDWWQRVYTEGGPKPEELPAQPDWWTLYFGSK